jgi:hypothetical protein
VITHFLVSPNPEPSLGAAVFAVGVINPLEELAAVEKDLRECHVSGRVLFDLLLAHGNKINRYFLAEFDGTRFQKENVQPAEDRYMDYSAVSVKFLKEHAEEVDPSLLSHAMQYALRTGLPL